MQSIKIKDTVTSEVRIIEIDTQDEHVVTMVLSAARAAFAFGPNTL